MPSIRRSSVVAGVVLAPVLLVVGGILFTADDVPAPEAPSVQAAVDPGRVSGDPQEVVAALVARVERVPQDDAAWSALGFAYIDRARTTADPSFYERAADALEQSLQVRPDDNADALAGQAALANARHDFALGRDLATQAVAINPFGATAKGILADAQLELGEYDTALDTLQEMVDLRPGVPSFTRISYSQELRGETESAEELLERAIDMSSADADASFCLNLLGRIAFDTGRYAEAVERYDEGARRDPANVEVLAGRAAAQVALGNVDAAVQDYETVVAQQPQPLFVVAYAELLDSLGRADEADDQFAVAEAISALYDDAGVVPDIEIVLYEADHGDPVRALEIAELNAQTRSSVQVEDALAWALHANGRDSEALVHAEAAMAIGTRSALWDYHRGMIQLELGLLDDARASLERSLATSPEFSPLHSPLAREALAGIGSP